MEYGNLFPGFSVENIYFVVMFLMKLTVDLASTSLATCEASLGILILNLSACQFMGVGLQERIIG